MRKHTFIELPISDVNILIPTIEKRMQVLKNRVLKTHGEDWYDLDEEGINLKVSMIDKEFDRLDLILSKLYESTAK